jgi:hypothetical protein
MTFETLDQVVYRLVQHGLERCGPGFGKYPLGVRHAVHLLLPHVDPNFTMKNGLGEPGPKLIDLVEHFDRRLELP